MFVSVIVGLSVILFNLLLNNKMKGRNKSILFILNNRWFNVVFFVVIFILNIEIIVVVVVLIFVFIIMGIVFLSFKIFCWVKIMVSFVVIEFDCIIVVNI